MTSKEAVLELICEAKSVNRDEGRVCFLRKIIKQDLEQLEKLKKDLQYLQDNGAAIFMFPRSKETRVILGFDMTDCPSEVENKKEILENAMNNIKEMWNCEK